ncbi:unnamed protein product [Bemisia tabaci]|uniref:Major facilitator superfamily (MFS) profile domain-containing protein n=1 Tax=Bemisia tabaci TaxID=7038 RepID=A0A9P0AAL9_BEMTA|nr:unnamed protein product [Bemisia tabaci]
MAFVVDTEVACAKIQSSDEDESEKLSWRCWFRTLFAASGPLMVFLYTGVAEAHSAVLLHQLKKEDSHIPVTTDEATWIASLGILLAPISALLAGPVLDAFGRKKGLLSFFLSMGLGFCVVAFAEEVYHIYIGRCICAIAIGLEVTSVVYLAEICTKRQRSCFLSLTAPFFSLGVALVYLVGGYLPWQMAATIFSLSSFGFFVIQCFAPESPAWLFKTGQIEASTKSLRKLGRSHENILHELDLLTLSTRTRSGKFHLRAFLEPTVWKPFLILSIFHFITNAAGVFDVLYYTVDFVKAFGLTVDPLIFTVLLAVARFTTNCTLGAYFLVSVPRKFTTAFSGFIMAASLLGSTVYEYAYRDLAEKPLQWIPVTLTVIAIVASAMGMNFLPWIMPGEMFPLQVRGAMTGASFLVGTFCTFVSLKIYGSTSKRSVFGVCCCGLHYLPSQERYSGYWSCQRLRIRHCTR